MLENSIYFGGAMVVSRSGDIVDHLPLGQEGLLIADVAWLV
jgi:hypothetical protein